MVARTPHTTSFAFLDLECVLDGVCVAVFDFVFVLRAGGGRGYTRTQGEGSTLCAAVCQQTGGTRRCGSTHFVAVLVCVAVFVTVGALDLVAVGVRVRDTVPVADGGRVAAAVRE